MTGWDLIKAIKGHGMRATGKKISCVLDTCPCCQGRPAGFKRHGLRKRLFLVFADWVIRRVWSYLTRWKCPLCKRTFTLYPDFALPFKRYVLAFIWERCAAYVEDAARTYREGLKKGGVAISYEDAASGTVLWPSTLWRWVNTLGDLPVTVREALNLVKQKDPSTGVFGRLWRIGIRTGKFRSAGRGILLRRCRELVTVDRVYVRLFWASVFPDLATRCGWG